MKNKEVETYRSHRVGTVTAGLSMIVFGVLFLVYLLFDMLSYDVIFSLWPFMLVSLGIELLLSNFSKKSIVYDKAAVFLLVIMTLFVMGMAAADVCMEMAEIYMWKQI